MSYHDKRNASPGVAGASEEIPDGNASEVPPNATANQALLSEFTRAERSCEVNAQLASWCIDLTARLKCAQSEVMTYHEGIAAVADLQTEWERFKLAVWLAKKARRS